MSVNVSANRTAAGGLPSRPRRVVRVPRPRGPVTVRIVAVQRSARDPKHAEIAEAIATRVRATVPGAPVAVSIAHDDDSVVASLAVPADVVVVCGHSHWRGDGWEALLGVDLDRLSGVIRAGAVVFASCFLHGNPALSTLVARRTPAVACTSWAWFKPTPVIVTHLVTELVRGGRTRLWEPRLRAALTAVQSTAAAEHPRADWTRWQYATL